MTKPKTDLNKLPTETQAGYLRPTSDVGSSLGQAWRVFHLLEEGLLLEASRAEWSTRVVELYRLRQNFGHDSEFEEASRSLLETAALLRMCEGLGLPLDKLTEAHLLQWEERLLFQGLLPAKRFRLRRQQLLMSGIYRAHNPELSVISLHAALAQGGQVCSHLSTGRLHSELMGHSISLMASGH